jgi:hypothetical protein
MSILVKQRRKEKKDGRQKDGRKCAEKRANLKTDRDRA